MLQFHHIGVITRNIDECAERFLTKSIIKNTGGIFEETGQLVRVMFGVDSRDILYEFIEPLCDDSPVSGALVQGRDVLNHIGYTVQSIEDTVTNLFNDRSIKIGEPKSSKTFNDSLVQFLYTPDHMLIELIESGSPDQFNLI